MTSLSGFRKGRILTTNNPSIKVVPKRALKYQEREQGNSWSGVWCGIAGFLRDVTKQKVAWGWLLSALLKIEISPPENGDLKKRNWHCKGKLCHTTSNMIFQTWTHKDCASYGQEHAGILQSRIFYYIINHNCSDPLKIFTQQVQFVPGRNL